MTLVLTVRAGFFAWNRGSMRTVPVKYSADPFVDDCEPLRMISISQSFIYFGQAAVPLLLITKVGMNPHLKYPLFNNTVQFKQLMLSFVTTINSCSEVLLIKTKSVYRYANNLASELSAVKRSEQYRMYNREMPL